MSKVEKQNRSLVILGGIVVVLAILFVTFSDSILSSGKVPIPWFLIGIYLIGLTQAIVFYLFGDKLFAKGIISKISSSAITYHAWACFVFGLMLIFNTEELLHTSTGFTSVIGNNNDRVGLQLTQITGAWVLAFSFLSYGTVFFAKNNFTVALLLHVCAIFAQFSEVLIKLDSDGFFGLGARINTHHVVIQIIALAFLLLAYAKSKNQSVKK